MYPREEIGRWMPGEVAARAAPVGREVDGGAGATGGAWRAFGGSTAERSGHGPRGVRALRREGVRALRSRRVTYMLDGRRASVVSRASVVEPPHPDPRFLNKQS